MRTKSVWTFVVVLITGMAVACATQFSSESIRHEITVQRGQDPLSVFELDLGKFTTLLLKKAMTTEDGKVPFSGVRELQVAVYEAPSETGPAIDVTRIQVRGWEQVLRIHDPKRSVTRTGCALPSTRCSMRPSRASRMVPISTSHAVTIRAGSTRARPCASWCASTQSTPR